MQKLFIRFIKFPFQLMLKNVSIVILVCIYLILNKMLNSNKFGKIYLTANWVYSYGLKYLSNFFTHSILIFIVVLFLFATFVSVAISQDMFLIFQGRRRGLLQSLSEIRIPNLIWFLKVEIVIWLFFTGVAAFFFLLTFLLWKYFIAGQFALYSLLFFFIVLCPFFYLYLALGAMFSVFPLTSSQKIKKMLSFLSKKVIWKIYSFYFIRLTIENLFALILPVLFLQIFQSYYLAAISSIIGMLLPFILLRGSAYEFKIYLLRRDTDIREIFIDHFNYVEKLSK